MKQTFAGLENVIYEFITILYLGDNVDHPDPQARWPKCSASRSKLFIFTF